MVLCTALVAGCTPAAPPQTDAPAQQEKTETSKKDLQKVTVLLDWDPNTNHTGLYVAKELNYYEEEGLDVEIMKPDDAGAANLVAADKAQFGVSYQEQVTMARTADKPLPVKAIAAVIQHNDSGFASAKAKNITRPKDFENKTYGGWGSPMETATLKALIEGDGGKFDLMKQADIGGMNFFAAQETGVDFSWIYYSWDGVAAELKEYPINFVRVVDFDKALDYYTPVLITSDTIANENPELVKKFMRATTKGYEYAINEPEKAGNILLDIVPELDSKLVLASQQYLADKYAAGGKWGIMKEEVWKNYAQWLLDRQLIPKPLNTQEAYTNEFLPE